MGVELAERISYGQFQQQRQRETVTMMMDDDDGSVIFSDSELVSHVRNALISVHSGDTDNYDKLVGVMHRKERLAPDEVALLETSLKALSGTVSCIDYKYHKSLVDAIFGMSMWNYGPDVMDALLELIVSLAAYNGEYVEKSLDMLVSNFMPPMYFVDFLKQPRGQAKREQVLSRVHIALEGISELVPMAASSLLSIVIEWMPKTFRGDLEKDRLNYRTQIFVENMLRLESGAMGEFVGNNTLMAVVDLLIGLDVAIDWDDILRDDSCKGMFTIELEDGDATDEEENDDSELPRTLNLRSLSKNAVANLLDTLMVRFCEHLELCANNKRLSQVFETLLHSFMRTILNTYKSKFAQFVIFYACALDPEDCGVKFTNTLFDTFVNGDNHVTRMSAVSYLASYLARAKFLPARSVVDSLKRLVHWCSVYCTTRNSERNPLAHRVFYSGCQAIMYVLCFRMRSIIDVPRLRSQLFSMPIESILKSRLEPLVVCLPSIVEEFLKQAKAARLFDTSETFIFQDLLESALSRDFGGLERLDMFFPFDPCLLKKCDRNFIRPNFLYWKSVKATYGDNEEDSSDDDSPGGVVVANGKNSIRAGMVGSFDEDDIDIDIDIDEFDYAMNKMSITPKNSLINRIGGEQLRMPSRIRPSTSPESL